MYMRREPVEHFLFPIPITLTRKKILYVYFTNQASRISYKLTQIVLCGTSWYYTLNKATTIIDANFQQ